jgi:hypothetical protein
LTAWLILTKPLASSPSWLAWLLYSPSTWKLVMSSWTVFGLIFVDCFRAYF